MSKFINNGLLALFSMAVFSLQIACGSKTEKQIDQIAGISISEELKPAQTVEQREFIENYSSYISSFHDESDYREIALQLDGEWVYENDSLLLLSFSEILEYGSWHYLNSTIAFVKQADDWTMLRPDPRMPDNGFDAGKELLYPYRVNGRLHELVDLTGDGQAELIFCSSTLFRDEQGERYRIYQLDRVNHRLHYLGLEFGGSSSQGNCEEPVGEQLRYSLYRKGGIKKPVLGLIRRIVDFDCNLNQKLIEYSWNADLEQFEKL